MRYSLVAGGICPCDFAMTIVEELRTNPESGARRLETEYKAGLMVLARRLCVDEGDAEELVNRTFADVVEGIDDYLERSAFFGWMCKILENHHAKDIRRKSNRCESADSAAVERATDDRAAERILQEVDATLLRDAIESLPDDIKKTVVSHYFLGLSVRETARLMAVPSGTVSWRLHCARMILGAKFGAGLSAAVRKPGVKAILIALALIGALAFGAIHWAGSAESSESSGTSGDSGVSRTFGASETSGISGSIGSSCSSVPSEQASIPQISTPSQNETRKTMKKSALISSAVGVSLAVTAASQSVASAAGADTLAYWCFGGDAEGIADASGNWNDLANGGVAVADGAAVFDGTVKRFSTRRPLKLSTSQAYTIECFVKSDAPHAGMIMELSSSINNNVDGFYLLANEGVMARGSAGYNGKKFSTSVCDGEWHHVAIVVDPAGATAAAQLRLYVDKTEQTVQSQKKAGTRLQSYRLFIGSRGDETIAFKGQIDDVRITAGALSPDDFLASRSEGSLDVRAWWKFDGSDPYADASGNGNTLLGDSGVSFAGDCAAFDGSRSNVRTSDTLDLSDSRDVTVEFFVRKHRNASDIGMLLEHSQDYFTHPQGFFIDIDDGRQGGVQGCFRFADSYRRHLSPGAAINAGWHHVALVKDSSKAGTSSCSSLYVDGILQKEVGGSTTASGEALLNDYLYIGSRANNSYFVDADIDDIRITAQALQPWQFLRTRSGALDDVIALWQFRTDSKLLEDASGNGNALTGSGVSSYEGAALFGSSGGALSTVSPLPLYPYESVTLEWYMKSSMSATGVAIETTKDSNANAGGIGVFMNDGKSGAVVAGTRTLTGRNMFEAAAAIDGEWHHYALVFDWDDPGPDVVRFYRDGVKVTTHRGNFADTDCRRLLSDTLYIGARAGTSLQFVGSIDDVRITGRALDPSEFLDARSVPQGFVLVFR